MKKFYYRLLAKGYKTQFRIGGQLISTEELLGEEKVDSVYYSKRKYVVANDEDVAKALIREKLGRKWKGFQLEKVN